MGAKLKAVRTELILLGLTAVFLGGLLTVSYRDRTTAEVAVTAEHTLPPEEVEVTLVDLNTAEAEELATLPGIGKGLAKRIVDYRTEHGPFEGPEGLHRREEVRGAAGLHHREQWRIKGAET